MSDPTNVDAVLVTLLILSIIVFVLDYFPNFSKSREGFLAQPWYVRHMTGIVSAGLVIVLSAAILYRMVAG